MTNKEIEKAVASALEQWAAHGNQMPLDRLVSMKLKEALAE